MKAAARSRRDRIRAQLADLKMPGALEAIDDVLTGVDGGGVTASEAIEQLLGAQITLRNNRRLQAAMRSSRLPGIKTLDDFDFSFQPSIKREQIDSLHELGFLARKENVIFLGPPGVGKTHLAISLAIAAAQSGRRVYYGALADLITSLEEAKTTGQLGRRLKILTYPSLLVIDEIGYLPVSQTGAMLFFTPAPVAAHHVGGRAAFPAARHHHVDLTQAREQAPEVRAVPVVLPAADPLETTRSDHRFQLLLQHHLERHTNRALKQRLQILP